jgi:hypothetical protein
MSKYFDLRQQEARRGQHAWMDQNVDAPYLTRDFLKHGKALLGRASMKAPTTQARKRIDRHLLSIDYVEAIRERRCVTQGLTYGPADPARVRTGTQSMLKTAAELGVTNLREGYPISRQARDWGDVGARYPAIVLMQDTLEATVIPDLEGRVIALGRANVLRVPDPGELYYPAVGGIHVSLSDGHPIKWQVESTTAESVTMNGTSDSGRVLQMRIGIAGGVLQVRVTLTNQATAPLRAAILCRAEFALGLRQEALLQYRGKQVRIGESVVDGGMVLSGNELPKGEWVISSAKPALQIRNRFREDEVARCGFDWSFRGAAGLNINLSIVSPERELAPGQQFTLTSEYDLMDSRQLQ